MVLSLLFLENDSICLPHLTDHLKQSDCGDHQVIDSLWLSQLERFQSWQFLPLPPSVCLVSSHVSAMDLNHTGSALGTFVKQHFLVWLTWVQPVLCAIHGKS